MTLQDLLLIYNCIADERVCISDRSNDTAKILKVAEVDKYEVYYKEVVYFEFDKYIDMLKIVVK